MSKQIRDYLRTGRENAISKKELVEMTGYSERTVRALIARERKNGTLIMSAGGSSGYWLPSDREEVEDFIKTMEKRAKCIFSAIKCARQELGQMEGQLYFTGEGEPDGN